MNSTLATIAFGSNVGDRKVALAHAFGAMSQLGEWIGSSSVYETDPMYLSDQPAFWNAVWRIRTEMGPLELLHHLLRIEQEAGRVRSQRYGPRTLDLDLLTYGALTYRFVDGTREVLTLPHPRIAERPFVLEPLAELDGHPIENPHCRKLGTLWELLPTSETIYTS